MVDQSNRKTGHMSKLPPIDAQPTLSEGITMKEQEEMRIAIERNIRIQLKLHPDPRNFIRTLQNEAIDQAFKEVSNRFYTLEKHVDFLEKRTHHLAPKIPLPLHQTETEQ